MRYIWNMIMLTVARHAVLALRPSRCDLRERGFGTVTEWALEDDIEDLRQFYAGRLRRWWRDAN